jgi:hypothetical protein
MRVCSDSHATLLISLAIHPGSARVAPDYSPALIDKILLKHCRYLPVTE